MIHQPVEAQETPKMYTDFAAWWPLLSAPADYAEEADFMRQVLIESCRQPPQTLLELGSGGGNNASHLKQHFEMTLVDPSAGMLAVSRALNPECEHLEGDMRSLRLGRQFDAVLIHDAIDYMTTLDDLRQALETAYVHCRPGGAALFAPDHTREIFAPSTDHGGHDGEDRAMRYLEWSYDPDESDTTYTVDYAYLFHEGTEFVRVAHDRHIFGLFSREEWLTLLQETGFEAKLVPDPFERELFVGVRGAPS